MTLVLGHERAGRNADALNVISEIEDNAPDDLRYFVFYAQFRLLGNNNVDARRRALENMLSAADTNARRISALTYLIELPGDRNAHALALLELQPGSRAAYNILAAMPAPRPAAVTVAMGVHEHRRNEHRAAVSLLAEVPQGQGWRRATYFRAFSLERLGRYSEALGLFETLALSGNEYADLSVQRIVVIAGRAERARAVAALRRVANERKGRVQSRAMFALVRLTEGAESGRMENALIQAYPESVNTVRILWRRGWAAWNAGNFGRAVEYWKRVCAPGVSAIWEARALYWIGAAQMSMRQPEEAEKNVLRPASQASCFLLYIFVQARRNRA
jgi:tetratricopeptide (TPR) repeat protein